MSSNTGVLVTAKILAPLKLRKRENVIKELSVNKESVPEAVLVHSESLFNAESLWGVQIKGYIMKRARWYAVVKSNKIPEKKYAMYPLLRSGKTIFIDVSKNDLGSPCPRHIELFILPYSF